VKVLGFQMATGAVSFKEKDVEKKSIEEMCFRLSSAPLSFHALCSTRIFRKESHERPVHVFLGRWNIYTERIR